MVIMADGRPFKWVKFHKPQKAHLQSLRDVCVQYKINLPMGFRDICSGKERWPDIWHNKANYCRWLVI